MFHFLILNILKDKSIKMNKPNNSLRTWNLLSMHQDNVKRHTF